MDQPEKIIEKINRSILGEEEIAGVVAVLKSGLLSKPAGGPVVQRFQSLFAEKFSRKYAYAVNSGTSALHLATAALQLGKDDEVIVPALANIADCSVVIQEGAKPVFADIDPDNLNIDPRDVKKKITKNTKAIIVVHMYGEPAEIKKLRSIADNNNLVLIEDCAQACGAKYDSKYVGSFGDMSCFSFYQTKHIVTGEGGMVLTNNKKWLGIIDSLANNGIKKDDVDAYNYDKIGYNYQMTEVQAAQGIVQLSKLDRLNTIRRQNVKLYKKQLRGTGIIFQKTNPESENVYFYLTCLLPLRMSESRDEFMEKIRAKGVPIKKLYPLSLPEVETLRGHTSSGCPVAKSITKRLFNVYVNPGLERADIISFTDTIKDIYGKF